LWGQPAGLSADATARVSANEILNETSKNKRGWRILRRALITLAVLATLIAIFYTEEDWRGKRAWKDCKHELEVQGAVFDWNTRIPPPVPDEQNIFKAPRMTEWFVGRGSNDLSQRLANPKTSSISPTNAIQTEADARDYLAWSDQFSPDFDLIRAALKRPYARIDCDYGQPMTVLAPNFVTVRIVVQTLAQRTRCFLLLGEPDQALREMTLMHDFCRIFEGAPSGKPITLVAAMINVAVTGLYAGTIGDGLRMRAWREPQLNALERQLSETDLAPYIAETFVDEPMFTLRTLETASRADLVKLFIEWSGGSRKSTLLLLKYAPQGWLDQNMVVHAELVRKFSDGFDATNQTVSPREIDDTGRMLQDNITHVSPHNFMVPWSMPNYVKGLQKYAYDQTSAHEAAVACALERYRLAQGQYPETLDALVPQFMEKLPHDIIGGGPLHYRRTDDGKFLLYSLGWNETDDGGTRGTLHDPSQGDWVW
jgi:hypothetical protein